MTLDSRYPLVLRSPDGKIAFDPSDPIAVAELVHCLPDVLLPVVVRGIAARLTELHSRVHNQEAQIA